MARDNYLISPISLYFLLASGSGTQKTAADNIFLKAARHWEALIRKKPEPEVLSALTQHKVWQMEKDSLFTQIKRATYTGEGRFYQEPPESIHSLTSYEQRITACLNQSEQLSHQGCIKLPLLKMSLAAKKQWILFFKAVEAGLKSQGQWIDVVDFASKAAKNTARLAALFHLFEGRHGDNSVEHTEYAIEIISWHLAEEDELCLPKLFLSNLTMPLNS